MRQINKFKLLIILMVTILLTLISGTFAACEDAPAMPDSWVGTYTPEEIAAIERSLWAGNMTLEDLKFRKDYTKGYACFPVVRDMMADPMSIAPVMDNMVKGFNAWESYPAPYGELFQALTYYKDDRWSDAGLTPYSTEANEVENFPFTIDYLQSYLQASLVFSSPELGISLEEADILRQYLPEQMAWHKVFESPFTEEQITAWDKMLEDEKPEYLYDLASKVDIVQLGKNYTGGLPDPRGIIADLPHSAFPRIKPVIIETPNGRVGIGTYRDDTWRGDFAALVDPGGNDHYINCRIGAAYGTYNNRVGYFADLGGNDFYDCGDVNFTCGAAILGIAAFYDLGQGNDRYVTGSCSLGAAMGGIATFYDDGGSDTYESKVYAQGAAGFGVGIMVDDSVQLAQVVPMDEETPDPIDFSEWDNDHYYAWVNAQAFARPKGVAICSNKRGNEIYEAGGVYLHAPLFQDRYQSFSQGFAIGERDLDYAGGIALILDYAGNDRYLGDVYNQGVGYWYSAGFLYDVAGNDTYEMHQYGQGSGIHLAIGGLVDCGGNDSYTMHSGLGTGGSHDYASSVLHDRGGNDQYSPNTTCNGGSLTNSAVIFIDRSGNDTYAARRLGGVNYATPARNFTSIGVLIDLDGDDDYLGEMDNNLLWKVYDIGVGWDTAPPPPPEVETVSGEPPPAVEPIVKMPDVITYEGELTQEIFDQLWEIAIRWEVGDNRFIVPKARDRIIAFGPEVLPYVSKTFDNMASGLALRAHDVVLKAFLADHLAEVEQVVRENINSDEEMRVRIAIGVITDLQIKGLESEVAALLDNPAPEMQRRAISCLAAISSHIADERLLANINPDAEQALIKVSMESLFALGVQCWDKLKMLLDHPTITVRETLVDRLVLLPDLYSEEVRAELKNAVETSVDGQPVTMSIRAMRSLLRVFTKSEIVPDEGLVSAVSILLDNTDWAIRGDAVALVRHWEDMSEAMLAKDAEGYPGLKHPGMVDVIAPVLLKVDNILKDEDDPYVRFEGTKE